tara:strand:- start:974 stop:4315 length:3342 start_codon:yes stop_codon:yes gene_type:complete
MSFNTTNQLSLSFKTLINKEFTTTAKQFYEEFGANTINTNYTEVWSSDVSSTPATAVSAGIAKQYTNFLLSPLIGFTTSVFYFVSGSVADMGGLTPGDNINRGTINENLLQRNFISTKYGAGYDVVLKQNDGTVVPSTDNSDWFWNYQTGILSVTNPGGHSLPYKLDVYQYEGLFLSQSLGTADGSGIFVQTGSFFATTNDLQITGSLVATAAITGNEGFSASAGKDFSVDNGSGTKIAVLQGDASNNGELILDDATGDQKVRLNEGGTGIISGSSLDVSGAIQSKGAISGSSLDVSGAISTKGSISGSSLEVSGDIKGASFTDVSLTDNKIVIASAAGVLESGDITDTGTTITIGNDGSHTGITLGQADGGTKVTIPGDLEVAGTASFTNTNNLTIKDKYILLASGSSGATDGGIVIEQAADGKGALFAYDSDTDRWGITGSFNPDTAAGYTPDAFMGISINGLAAIADIPSKYNKAGNIFVDSSNVSHIYTDKWEKLILSGSNAIVNNITAPGIVTAGSVSNGTNVLTIDANGLIHMTGSYGGGSSEGGGIFAETGSVQATTNDLQITGSLIVSSSTAIPIQASGQSINIGQPTNASAYGDGFFDTFTSATSLAQSIDEISKAFLDLAPTKAGVLGGTALGLSGASQLSGLLAYGLVSDHWYQNGYAAGQSAPFVNDGTFNLSTPSTSTTFRAGKNSDLVANTLEGGVTASVKFRNATATLTTRALDPDGQGTTAPLNITSLASYEIFWVKANARIEQSIGANDTGSYQYKILADNGAGETNAKNLMWVGSSTHYPNQTVTPGTVTSGSVTYNFLSGIQYLKTATFTIPGTADNMFNPVYQVDNIRWNSSFWSGSPLGGTTGADTPNFGDTLNYTKDLDLVAGTNSAQSAPTATITAFKPGKSSVNSSGFNISHTPVNSYVSAQSTAKIEYFLDEDKRVESNYSTAWTDSATLTTSNLQVQNGRLVTGNTGNYSGFTGVAYFFRKFTGFSVGAASGTFAFAASGFSSLSEWGSGTGLQAILVDQDDLTGSSPAKVYDLGKAQANTGSPPTVAVPGNAAANVFGIKTGTVGQLSGNWSLGTNGTIGASENLILVIAILDPNATGQLNQITLS